MAEYINKAELMEQYPEFDGYTFADVTTIDIPEEPHFETEAEGIAYLVGAFSVALDIVHCKDCRYFQKGWTKCKMLNLNGADGDWFCADATRRD